MKPDLSQTDPLEYNLATRVSIGDALSRAAALFPDRVAIIDGADGADGADEITYRQLDDTAERLARSLLDLGLVPHTPLTIMMGNSWRFLATYYACAKAGLVAMPVNYALAPDDQRWILHDAGTRSVVVDAQLLPILDAVLDGPGLIDTIIVSGETSTSADEQGHHSWQDLAATGDGARVDVLVQDRDTVQCIYTSGTTSRPKGVLVSHVALQIALLSNSLATRQSYGELAPVMLIVLPLFHTTALNTLAMPVLGVGGTLVLSGPPFDPDAALDAIALHEVSYLTMLPMMHQACVAAQAQRPRDLSSVRTAIYAMAPMPPALLDQVAAIYPNAAVILGSGQTEVVPATVMQWPQHQFTAAASWGVSTPSVQTAIMAPSGELLPTDETGEIVYRSPNVTTGYWNNPAANASAYEHGWFHSGDIGTIDAQGVVWFTDRLKDIIKTGGENVSSVQVESICLGAPGVAECSIIGLPDEKWGETVCAVVVPDGSIPDDELANSLISYAKAHLAAFQVPKEVRIVPTLPKTATGKIQKHELRRQVRED